MIMAQCEEQSLMNLKVLGSIQVLIILAHKRHCFGSGANLLSASAKELLLISANENRRDSLVVQLISTVGNSNWFLLQANRVS